MWGAATAFSRTLVFVVQLESLSRVSCPGFKVEPRLHQLARAGAKDWLKTPCNEGPGLRRSSLKSSMFEWFWTGSDRLRVQTGSGAKRKDLVALKSCWKGGGGTQEVASESFGERTHREYCKQRWCGANKRGTKQTCQESAMLQFETSTNPCELEAELQF